ncbi:enoyl-CoA hydratase/isomerase family protein [Chloroflexota bacterium]
MGDEDILLYRKKNRVVTITLNRPDKMNALNMALSGRICEAFQRFNSDDDALVAIITGAGDKAFSAGGDLTNPEELKIATGGGISLEWHHLDIWKPMIAAVNGFCMTLGWLLAQKCDIRIAAEGAKFGITATKLNFSGSFASEVIRVLHRAHALEIMLWGDTLISAQRAYEMGFVNRVVPQEKLMDEAMSWAERMLYLTPTSVRNIKRMIYYGQYMAPPQAIAFANALSAGLGSMEDTAEGVKAVLDKRKPAFKKKIALHHRAVGAASAEAAPSQLD